jgi:hypothetical protein
VDLAIAVAAEPQEVVVLRNDLPGGPREIDGGMSPPPSPT